jgi:hypothetical protein
MTWGAAITGVDQELIELIKQFKGSIPEHPYPKILALRVLLARERFKLSQNQNKGK